MQFFGIFNNIYNSNSAVSLVYINGDNSHI